MYESMIKCRGKPILPPVMTQERRAEARHYRNEAIRRQQLCVQHETGETITNECQGSPEKLISRMVSRPSGGENGTSTSRIPRSSSAQANLHLSRPSSQVRSRLLVDKDPSARKLRHDGPLAVAKDPRSQQEPSMDTSFVEREFCESPTKLERGGTFIVSSEGIEEKPQPHDLEDMAGRMRSEMCFHDNNVARILDSDSSSYESATDEDFSLTLSADASNTRDDTAAVSAVDDVSVLMLESNDSKSQMPKRPSSLGKHATLDGRDVELEKEDEQEGHDGCESRKCLGRRHTYLILQAKQKTPTLPIVPTAEKKHLQDLSERLQSCAHLVSSLTPTDGSMTNKSLASLHESFEHATSSSQSLPASKEFQDLNANRSDQGNSRRVIQKPSSDRNGNRGLQEVVRQQLDPKTARGFARFSALCKGHLCRKLLGCSRVQGEIASIADMVQMAYELHQLGEIKPNDQDLVLHEKVLLTLDGSCRELYRIFFEASSSEQIQLMRESSANRTTVGPKAPVKRLSSATLKRRIRLQKDAEQKRFNAFL